MAPSLQIVDNITAIGTDIKIPAVPRIDTLAHIENKSQTGCIPVLLPISLGVMKFESIKGIIRYNVTTIMYWYECKQFNEVAKVVIKPMIAPKNGAIASIPETIPQTIYLSTPTQNNPKEYAVDRIKQTASCPLIYAPNFELIGRSIEITEGGANLFNKAMNEFSILSQSFSK